MTDHALPSTRPTLPWPPSLWLAILLALLIATCLLAAVVGAVGVPLSSLLAGMTGQRGEDAELARTVLLQIRLPRIALAIGCGVALAVSGCVMQSLFRNPLADPGLLGVSSGAALGATVTIALGFAGVYTLPFAAFVGALGSTSLVMLIGKLQPNRGSLALLLAGIAVNAINTSMMGTFTYMAGDEALRSIVFWSLGSLGGATWQSAALLMPAALLLAGFILHDWRALNALLLGEAEAWHAGFDVPRIRRRLVLLVALLVGIAVALCGAIGFVGLVVPHLMRLLLGGNHRWLLPASALAGAMLLLFADAVARTVIAPAELPIGLLTSLIGGPFFLWLMVKGNR
ncbi:iron ABC transporter permease [Chitinivorax sp. B]|uniref:FecCD family ABC transporter permease n=1 Tax=Chitinivorax sp. B TaxID=2502235 RepID=UPI0010F919B6|nr:iron ABC transporter permease [Chitinivorax sp. B]